MDPINNEEWYPNDPKFIARLQQQVEAQAYLIQEQERRIQQLEEKLFEAQPQRPQTAQLDERFIHLREELLKALAEQNNHQRPDIREPDQEVKTQFDNYTRAISDLRHDVEATQRFDQQIILTRTEVERLGKQMYKFEARLDDFKKQIDERMRDVGFYSEGQRQADMRRMAELQAELPGLHKKIETCLAKVRTVEQQIPQFGKYELALEQVREEIRRYREHMDIQLAHRERQLKDWTEFSEAQERRMDEYTGLMEKYAEQYQLSKRTMEALQEFQERLQREQHQSSELQRLSERRLQAEMEKWHTEYDQRWKKQNLEWAPPFTDLQRTVELLQKRVDEATKFNKAFEEQIDIILQILEEDIQARSLAANNWQQRFEEIASSQG